MSHPDADPPDALSLTGHLLIAMPAEADPRFERTVIYICAHSEEGAMGLVINRPVLRPGFRDVLRQLGIDPSPPARDIRLCSGGPVDETRGFVLHSAEWSGDSTLRVTDAVSLTASMDVLAAVAAGRGPAQALLALGHAGWGPGQLETELTANAWLTVPADPALLFEAAAATQWTEAMARIGVTPAALSGVAGRA